MTEEVLNIDAITKQALTAEAKALLADFALTPYGLPLLTAGKEGCEKAVNKIVEVLDTKLRQGHLDLLLLGNQENETLYGYAIVVLSDGTVPTFIHKIWVDERARNAKLGTELLDAIKHRANGNAAALVVRNSIPFFRKNGFESVGEFPGLQTHDSNFTMSRGLYAGTTVMTTNPDSSGCNALLLNNQDLVTIIDLALGRTND